MLKAIGFLFFCDMHSWEKLIQPSRYKNNAVTSNSLRSAFDKDFDRVIFSPAFRKLQDKTQVVPLPEHDFVHTRLTHSLETSSVGRSLGKLAGEFIIKNEPAITKLGIDASDFGAIVAAACLAHDIGNPPFGHSGEAAFSDFFLNGNGKKYESIVGDDKKWADLIRFEGNANGFRLLTNYSGSQAGALRLTYPTLAAFSKYPKGSLPVFDKAIVSEKKFGFFQAEKAFFNTMANELSLIQTHQNTDECWARHPLTFLVEAADDICYHIIDFEDGLNTSLIDGHFAFDLLIPLMGAEANVDRLNQMIPRERHALLRAMAINQLIQECFDAFVQNYSSIMDGKMETSLLQCIPSKDFMKAIKNITREKVYLSKRVLAIESAGFEVISGILDRLLDAAFNYQASPSNFRAMFPRHFSVLQLIPNEFLPIVNEEAYLIILKMTEFVSGLTDRKAIQFYKQIHGMEIPI